MLNSAERKPFGPFTPAAEMLVRVCGCAAMTCS